MANEEIKNWLAGSRDYSEGLALFIRYSRNRNIIKVLQRKRWPEKLLWELGKMAQKGKLIQQQQFILPSVKISPAETNTKQHPTKEEDEINRLVVINNKVQYDDLPEELKVLYDQNRTLYKEMRSFHEKMKLASSDNDRAKFRMELIKRDDIVSKNWKTLDSFVS
jgi:hypothetical protein